MYGLRTEFTKVIGNIIKCMGREKSFLLMARFIKATTNTTRNTGMVLSFGLMAVSMSDTGKRASNMDGENTTWRMGRKESENGRRARGSSGSRKTLQTKLDKFIFLFFDSVCIIPYIWCLKIWLILSEQSIKSLFRDLSSQYISFLKG